MASIPQGRSDRLRLNLAWAVLLVSGCIIVAGQQTCPNGDNMSTCEKTGPVSSSSGENITTAVEEVERVFEDQALLLADYYKRLHRSEDSLADWYSDRFAFEDGRAAEFEALRMDEVPCDFKIPYVDAADLTSESFRDLYESQSKPVMIKNIPNVMEWDAATKWTLEGLRESYPDVLVKVGRTDDGYDLKMTIAEFLRYAETQKDDSPLYVFDTHFAKGNVGEMMRGDYDVPFLFPEDLFSCMDDARPPFRWFLIGPKRSGSYVHVDPLGTSAWNTLLSGRKLWVLSPPGTLRDLKGLPPLEEGEVDTSQDERPKKAINYFTQKLATIRENLKGKVEVTVLVQHPGETIFVPAGWAHGVLNLDDTVAITQNFVSAHNFDEVWLSTRNKRPKFAMRWLQRLLSSHPLLVHRALDVNRRDLWNMLSPPKDQDRDSEDDYDVLEIDDDDDDN